MSSFYKLQIKEKKQETPNAVSIVFAIPEALQSNFQFIAGQYVNVKLTLDGIEIRRAYSICSSPSNGELRIAIKSVVNGYFSKFANQNLNVGDFLEVAPPEGRFTFEPKHDKQVNYAAFVAGSGITPVMSILRSVLENEPKSSFVLIYGNKNEDETIFKEQLHDLQLKYVGRLIVHYVYSKINIDGQLFGRIDKANANFVLNKHNEKEFSKYYLCGPEPMINLVTELLKEKNVPEKDIKFELFSTSTINDKTVPTGVDGHTKITILVDGDETTFEMSQKQTILEAALKHGLDVPYSCQGGICSSCLAKTSKGTSVMKKNSILTDQEVADGLTLTCQAHPTSVEVFINYDDV